MLGWIAWISLPSAGPGTGTAVQVRPASTDRSKCTRQLFAGPGDSVLLPLTSEPSASRTGLFLTGPRMPSGKRLALLHVRPPSDDVRTIPHQLVGSGPTL